MDIRTDFAMYTPEGDAAVAAFVRHVHDAVMDATFNERADAVAAIIAGVDTLAATAPTREVYDTEPCWCIADALTAAFESRGWTPLEPRVVSSTLLEQGRREAAVSREVCAPAPAVAATSRRRPRGRHLRLVK